MTSHGKCDLILKIGLSWRIHNLFLAYWSWPVYSVVYAIMSILATSGTYRKWTQIKQLSLSSINHDDHASNLAILQNESRPSNDDPFVFWKDTAVLGVQFGSFLGQFHLGHRTSVFTGSTLRKTGSMGRLTESSIRSIRGDLCLVDLNLYFWQNDVAWAPHVRFLQDQ